jgi:hypothetical protein
VAEIRTAGTEHGVADRAGGRTADEQADNDSQRGNADEREQCVFHKRDVVVSAAGDERRLAWVMMPSTMLVLAFNSRARLSKCSPLEEEQ